MDLFRILILSRTLRLSIDVYECLAVACYFDGNLSMECFAVRSFWLSMTIYLRFDLAGCVFVFERCTFSLFATLHSLL